MDRHLEFFKSRSQTRVHNQFRVRPGYKPHMSALGQKGDMMYHSSKDASSMQKEFTGRKRASPDTYMKMRRKHSIKS